VTKIDITDRRNKMIELHLIKFKKFDARATIPKRATKYSGGFDLYAMEDTTVYLHSSALIDTGIMVAIPIGYSGFIWPRSGKSIEFSSDILAGHIDADYRTHTVKVAIHNASTRNWHIQAGDRIAQLVVSPVLLDSEEVMELEDLGTRTGGFGSTGTK